MKLNNKEFDAMINKVISDVRSNEPDPKIVRGAAERVWAKLSNEETQVAAVATAQPERIRNCSDFQALIQPYLDGDLSPARALLLEDHTLECVPCRRALKEARFGKSPMPAAKTPRNPLYLNSHPLFFRRAIAASLIMGLALTLFLANRFMPFGEEMLATVEAASGGVYRIATSDNQAISAGDRVEEDQSIRTARGGGAVVRLADNSLIEMKERSELSISENSRGTTINLERGNIIVQAAKQRDRHLYVATSNSLVSVTGTIFSVNSGTKGSRVSVLEGEVQVDQSGEKHVLHPGDQVSTHPSLAKVPIRDEISWSRDIDQYAKLLSELEGLRKELDTRVARPDVRYSSRLLELVPEQTVLYAALPNLSATLSDSYQVLREHIEQNPTLREWWGNKHGRGSSADDLKLNELMKRIREFGEQFGTEIVVSAGIGRNGHPDGLLVLAELKDAAGFRSFLERQLQSLGTEAKNQRIRIIDNPLATAQPDAGDEILIWIHDGLFAASPSAESLKEFATRIGDGTNGNRFNKNAFYARIAEVYREGAGLIVAADLQKIIASSVRPETAAGGAKSGEEAARRADAFRQLGVTDLKYFILELKEANGKPYNRAVLTFDEPRRGMASWLAAPGPMGVLEFISPDANMVAAFVVKEPVSLVGDLLNSIGTVDPALRQHLKDFETENNLNIRNDFAAPLGGEFAFAIDGPILPAPSWKVVLEVYDPAHLQQTLERLVERLNAWASREGRAGFQWERAESGGRSFYTLKSVDLGVEINYTFVNGYLVAAPSRALVERAMLYRESGSTLLSSQKFIATLPGDGNANFSALFYQNLAPLVEPLGKHLKRMGQMERDGKTFETLAVAASTPSLLYAYAEGDRIVFSANTEKGFGLTPGSLIGIPGSFGLQHIFHEGLRGE